MKTNKVLFISELSIHSTRNSTRLGFHFDFHSKTYYISKIHSKTGAKMVKLFSLAFFKKEGRRETMLRISFQNEILSKVCMLTWGLSRLTSDNLHI